VLKGKGFKFRLERVQRVREHAEREARERLAESIRHRARGEAQLLAARERVARARAARASAGSGAPAAAGELVALDAWLERTRLAAAELERSVADARAEEERRRADAARALQERKALERLRERKLAEHAASEARREAAVLDELGLLRRVGEAA